MLVIRGDVERRQRLCPNLVLVGSKDLAAFQASSFQVSFSAARARARAGSNVQDTSRFSIS